MSAECRPHFVGLLFVCFSPSPYLFIFMNKKRHSILVVATMYGAPLLLRACINDVEGVQCGGVGGGTGSYWSSPQINPRGWTAGRGLLFHGTRTWLQKNQPPRSLILSVIDSEIEACLLAPRIAHVTPRHASHWSPAINSWGIVSV